MHQDRRHRTVPLDGPRRALNQSCPAAEPVVKRRRRLGGPRNSTVSKSGKKRTPQAASQTDDKVLAFGGDF
jgi:hypothetical protein